MTNVLRLPETIARVGLGRSAIYEAIKAGTFPRPIKLGERAVGFIEDEVEEWLKSRPRAGK